MKLSQPVLLEELAQLCNSKIMGDPRSMVTGINEIHMVEKGDLTFVDHPKYYEKALNSAATFIIINKEVTPPEGKGLLISDDPFRDYVKLVKYYRPFESAGKMISASSSIGENTQLQPGVFVGNHVKIGNNCIIHPGVVIYDHCKVGDNVIIHANTVIGADAFYFKRRPSMYDKMESCGAVIIEDNVEIGASCTIDKGVSGNTIIGWGTKMDNHIHVGHDTVIGKNCLIAAQAGIAGVVKIEDDVIIWGQVGVQKDLVIGKGAVIFGQSGVSKSLKGDAEYFGSPAREAREAMKDIFNLRMLPRILEDFKKDKS